MLAKDWQQVIFRDKTELYNQAHEGGVPFLLKPHNALQVICRDDPLFDETLAKGHIVLHFRFLPRTTRRAPLVRPNGPRQVYGMTGQLLYSRCKHFPNSIQGQSSQATDISLWYGVYR